MKELMHRLRRFSEQRDWDQFRSPKNLAMALSVEAAEIVEHFQWLTQAESGNLPPHRREEIRDEIGDVMIYLAKLGIDPLRAAHEKLEKNEKKYPIHRVKGKPLKYTEY